MTQNQIVSMIMIVALIGFSIGGSIALVQYLTESESDPIPIYTTITHESPIYSTECEQIPQYTMLYSVELIDSSVLTTTLSYSNIYAWDSSYTGADFWGDATYTVILYDADGLEYDVVHEINEVVIINSYEVITGYSEYCTEVIIGYSYHEELVISGYQ